MSTNRKEGHMVILSNFIKNQQWKNVQLLSKGWSSDIKYYVETNDGRKRLLRISSAKLYEFKKRQFQWLKDIFHTGLFVPEPLEIGTLEDGRVYLILSWVEGEDAREILPKLDIKSQYELGKDAGFMLKKIHSVPIESNYQWYEIYQKKIQRKIDNALSCAIQHKHCDKFIDYVMDHMKLLKNSSMTLQHGDFHLGNMVLTNDLKLGVIDFDKLDLADPVDDFKPFVWNVLQSKVFATGLIDGYFSSNPPLEFFQKLAVYAAESCIGHLPWAIGFGEEEVQIAIEIADKVFDWYCGFETVIPTWYDESLKSSLS